jgi:hypothetical protein
VVEDLADLVVEGLVALEEEAAGVVVAVVEEAADFEVSIRRSRTEPCFIREAMAR